MQLSRLEILEVTPCEVAPTCPPGMWPCANCGDEQPVQRNSIVSFRAEPYREVRKTLVCEACADELRRETPQDARLPRRTDVASTRRATLGRVRDRLRR